MRLPRRLSPRALVFLVLVAACVAAGATSLALAVAQAHSSHPPDGVRVLSSSAHLSSSLGPVILFRNTIPDKTFGKVAFASLKDPDVRTVTGLTCDRVYYARGNGLCLRALGAFSSKYEAEIFNADFVVRKTFSIPGIPSRARISADGRLGAMTTFVNGDSYAPGNFSTRTQIVDMRTGDVLGNLEQFTVLRDGKRFKKQNFNFWGVTFARDDQHIYATLGSGADTYLVGGTIRSRTLRVLTTHLECPSLSPDGTRIAFKQSLNSHGSWRLYVLDLATMKRHPLAEPNSVDDQVEWLNDTTVLYWRGDDVWRLPADGSGHPAVFVKDASSPTVVRNP